MEEARKLREFADSFYKSPVRFNPGRKAVYDDDDDDDAANPSVQNVI